MMKRRILALLLVLSMVVVWVPSDVFAASETEHTYGDWTILEGSEEEGYIHKVRTCTTCGQTEARISGANVVQFVDYSSLTSCELTRANIMVYLWYKNGCQEPESLETVFTDLDSDAYYYKACLWAVEQGLVNGTTQTTFEPKYECTRGQIATFLWRAAGNPDVNVEDNPFTDLKEGSSYYKAVLWAYQTQQPIAANVTGAEFEPKATATYNDLLGVSCANYKHCDCEISSGTVATCQNYGYGTFTCNNCGETYSKISKIPHTYTESTGVAATCQHSGYETFTCDICGGTYTIETDKLEHTYTNYVLDEATGLMEATCDYCHSGRNSCWLTGCSDKTVMVDRTSTGSSGVTVKAGTIQTLSDYLARAFVIKTDEATVSFDTAALEAMANVSDDVTLKVQQVEPTETNFDVSEGNDAVATMALSISLCDSNGNSVLPASSMSSNGTITVTVPYQQTEGTTVSVYCVDENGVKDPVESTVENGYLTFTTRYLSNHVVTEDGEPVEKIEVDGTGTGSSGVTVGAETIQTISNNAACELVIKTDEATVSFDTDALAAIAEVSDDVTLKVQQVEPTETNFVVSEGNDAVATMALSISLCDSNGNSVLPASSMSSNGTITVTIPYQKANGTTVIVYYVDENGMKDPVESKVENGYLTFTTSHFSDYVVTEASESFKKFEDVPSHRYYYQPTLWAATNLISTGTDDGTSFAPDVACTRGQIVTFLWRYAGEPEPESTSTKFTDLNKNASYYKAVLWAAEQGITNGDGSETKFNPGGTCTRSQVVTFLYRFAGSPAVTNTTHSFKDVKSTAFYYNAMLWAVENGITNGDGSSRTFNPKGDCTRGQIITFLYRYNNA